MGTSRPLTQLRPDDRPMARERGRTLRRSGSLRPSWRQSVSATGVEADDRRSIPGANPDQDSDPVEPLQGLAVGFSRFPSQNLEGPLMSIRSPPLRTSPIRPPPSAGSDRPAKRRSISQRPLKFTNALHSIPRGLVQRTSRCNPPLTTSTRSNLTNFYNTSFVVVKQDWPRPDRHGRSAYGYSETGPASLLETWSGLDAHLVMSRVFTR